MERSAVRVRCLSCRGKGRGGRAAAGYCWTLPREIAVNHAERYGLPLVSSGLVSKRDVLALITHYGEEEIVIRREHVRL